MAFSRISALLLGAALAIVTAVAGAATQEAPNLERGWFYFEEPPAITEPENAPPAPRSPTAKAPDAEKEKERCSKKGTWTAQCGFVNPGQDFEFQAKQRDELMQAMVMSNNNPKAVEAFQYYMHWVLERTSEVANLWWYNMVQNPELDPTAAQPVSAMGLKLMTEVQKGSEKEVFDLVKKEGGMFVYFSRDDCAFCHHMSEPLRMLTRRTGIDVRNAALDGKCMAPYKDGCVTGEQALAAGQALQVSTVPSVFLYVKPNTWIRIGTGVTDTATMATRAMQFFSAYRNALLKGIKNTDDGVPSVDFGSTSPTGLKTTGIQSDSKRPVSESMVTDLLRQ